MAREMGEERQRVPVFLEVTESPVGMEPGQVRLSGTSKERNADILRAGLAGGFPGPQHWNSR